MPANVVKGIVGDRFVACYRRDTNDAVIRSVSGGAFVVSDVCLLFDPEDPFGDGLRMGGA